MVLLAPTRGWPEKNCKWSSQRNWFVKSFALRRKRPRNCCVCLSCSCRYHNLRLLLRVAEFFTEAGVCSRWHLNKRWQWSATHDWLLPSSLFNTQMGKAREIRESRNRRLILLHLYILLLLIILFFFLIWETFDYIVIVCFQNY